MPYTEIKSRDKRKYFYRVNSIREGKKVKKKRIYLGTNLSPEELLKRQSLADNKLRLEKVNKSIDKIKKKILPILKKNKVKKAGIFGSYARGEQKKNSDVDVLIQPPKSMGLRFFGLEAELRKKLRKKVDLVTYKGIYHLLRDRILREEIRII